MKKAAVLFFTVFVFTACPLYAENGSLSGLSPDLVSIDRLVYDENGNLNDLSKDLFSIDLDGQDIEKASLQTLKFMRGAVLAKYGEIFAETDLRDYFLENARDYRGNMLNRWKSEFSLNEKPAKEGIYSKTVLSPEDSSVLAKIDAQTARLEKNNFINADGYPVANVLNIVNFFKFKNPGGGFLQKLSKNNMVITAENKKRLFDIYIENNYYKTPSFITTDLMICVYETYLTYAKRLLQSKSEDVSFIDEHWARCMRALTAVNAAYPPFMRLSAWQIKNLNSSMAAELLFKNSANFTFIKKEPVEKPEGGTQAKENDDNPPPAYTLGWVEPNILFWQKTGELLDLTVKTLEKNSLLSADLRRKTDKLKDISGFLYETSFKELNGETLNRQECERIAWFGDEIQAVTYFFLEKQKDALACVSVFARQKDEVLYEALGNAAAVYAVVETGGSLYLMKGAVFSYYEFSRRQDVKPFTAKDWQKITESAKTPDAPAWIKDYTANFSGAK
jgi:hypothetical protein